MNELEVRKVPFMGTELMAARVNNGQIWAGVRWMCDGVGLSEGQTKNERLKIQKDKVLSKGGRNFVLNESGYGNREVLCPMPLSLPKNGMGAQVDILPQGTQGGYAGRHIGKNAHDKQAEVAPPKKFVIICDERLSR